MTSFSIFKKKLPRSIHAYYIYCMPIYILIAAVVLYLPICVLITAEVVLLPVAKE